MPLAPRPTGWPRVQFRVVAAALPLLTALWNGPATADPGAMPPKERTGPAFPDAPQDPAVLLDGLSGLFLGAGSPTTEIWDDPVATIAAGGSERIAIGPFPTTVRIDTPAGTAASVEIRRVTGSLPEVLWAQDAEGRAWSPSARREPRAVRVEEIPVLADGGVDLVLVPTRTGHARVEVSVTIRPLAPGEPVTSVHPNTPWAPGIVVAVPGESVPCAPEAEFGLPVIGEGEGYVRLALPEDRFGLEWTDAAYLESLCSGGIRFEPDAYAEPPEGSQTNQAVVGSEFGRFYPQQPGLRTIQVPPRTRGLTGAGVVIAVLDTGLDPTHPRFAGRLLPGIDLVDGDDDPSEAANGLDDDLDGNEDDGFGHGTLVAGIALAVAPEARILPVRVLDDEGLGTASRVADGVRWAVAQGADVVNMSLGTRAWSGVLESAVLEAVEAGVIVVVSAGNRGDRWSVDFPADVPGVIAVSALGIRGRPAGFTNGRRPFAIFAPGVRVIGPWPGATWAQATGTSFAAPFAAGAAALLRQDQPGATSATFRARCCPRLRLDLRSLWR